MSQKAQNQSDEIIDIRSKRKVSKKTLFIITTLLFIFAIGQSAYILKLQSENKSLRESVVQKQSIIQSKDETIQFFDDRVAFWSPTDNHFHHYDCKELDKQFNFPTDVNYANTEQSLNTGLTPCPLCREEAKNTN